MDEQVNFTSDGQLPIPVVAADSLKKTFHMDGSSLDVLKGIDLRMAPGTSAAIIGPSGAGKSTLLHILGLLEKPTGGSYFFEGKDVSRLSDQEKAEMRLRRMGFIFQFHHLLPEFTALENVMLPALMLGRSKMNANSSAQNYLDRVGLKNRSSHRPGELSGGEQQRVALARALVNEPAMILADEPTGNLDVESAEMTASLLKEISKQNNSLLLLVTHNRRLAREMDVVLVMDDGRLASGNAALDSII